MSLFFIIFSIISLLVAYYTTYHIASYILNKRKRKVTLIKTKSMKEKAEYRLLIKFNLQTLEMLREMALTDDPETQVLIFACDSIPQDILYLLCNSKSSGIRAGVARQKNIPMDIATTLSKDVNSYVKQVLGHNKVVPASIKINMLTYCSESCVWDAVLDTITKEDVSKLLVDKQALTYRG